MYVHPDALNCSWSSPCRPRHSSVVSTWFPVEPGSLTAVTSENDTSLPQRRHSSLISQKKGFVYKRMFHLLLFHGIPCRSSIKHTTSAECSSPHERSFARPCFLGRLRQALSSHALLMPVLTDSTHSPPLSEISPPSPPFFFLLTPSHFLLSISHFLFS